jgi:4-hydroxy-3-polyprenylbenzoate decarboxylase
MRRDAVYGATIVGVPPMEDAYIAKATERIFLAPIRLAIQPEVRDLYMPIEGTAHNIAFVSIAKRYLGQPNKVAQGLWGAGQMMFNKYLVIADESVDIRSKEHMCRLFRGLDVRRGIIWSEGILDVLDHATPTLGYGSKMAIDLTDVAADGVLPDVVIPDSVVPCGGVACFSGDFVQSLGLVVLFADKEWQESVDVETYLKSNGMEGVKYVALFDYGASEEMTSSDLLWLAAANTDPRRDIRLVGDTVVVDARSKRPGYGDNPSRFPNVVTSHPDTIKYVDDRWAQYGIGEFMESPSRRYRRLWLSDEAQW